MDFLDIATPDMPGEDPLTGVMPDIGIEQNAPCPPQCPDLGYPSNMTFHLYAHQSIDGMTSCGQSYSPVAAQAMTDLHTHLAANIQQQVQASNTDAGGGGAAWPGAGAAISGLTVTEVLEAAGWHR